jgi:hypothetical protein
VRDGGSLAGPGHKRVDVVSSVPSMDASRRRSPSSPANPAWRLVRCDEIILRDRLPGAAVNDPAA